MEQGARGWLYKSLVWLLDLHGSVELERAVIPVVSQVFQVFTLPLAREQAGINGESKMLLIVSKM